jgi:hypothetical protein
VVTVGALAAGGALEQGEIKSGVPGLTIAQQDPDCG